MSCVWLNAEAARELAKGEWPRLRQLDLAHNGLGNWGMMHLAKGQWPLLNSIQLRGNGVISPGVFWLSTRVRLIGLI